MASDLEQNLINGGVTAAAAKVLANAIANAASAQLAIGRRYGDATPREQLRLVDSDARRYVLTNLDQTAPAAPMTASRSGDIYTPRDTRHPYADSQPATAQPTLTAPAVKPGDYIDVSVGTKDSVAQSTISARIASKGGQHARLNPATKAIDAVPFSVEVAQEQFVEASFEERATGTVLKIRLKNLQQFVDNTGKAFWGWADY